MFAWRTLEKPRRTRSFFFFKKKHAHLQSVKVPKEMLCCQRAGNSERQNLLVSHLRGLESDGWEGGGKDLNVSLELLDGWPLLLVHGSPEVLELGSNLGLDVGSDLDRSVDKVGDLDKVSLHESSGGEGGGSHPQSTGNEGAGVAGNGVLVGGNVSELQNSLNSGSIDSLRLQVDQEQVVVGSAGDESVPELLESPGKGGAVLHDLLLVDLELGGGSHLEATSQGGDGVVVRAALVSGEDREVNGVRNVVHDWVALLVVLPHSLPVEDHGASWAPEGLGGGGDDVSVVKGGLHDIRGHEPTDVSHVGQEPGVGLVRDLPHPAVVVEPSVGARAGDDELWPEKGGVLLQSVVVNQTGLLVEPVGHGLVVDAHGGDLLLVGLVAVAEVAAVRKVERHDAVVGLEERAVDVEVRGGSGEGLDVDAPLFGVQPEGLEGPLLAEALGHIDELVSAVVPRAGVALRVLVGHDGSEGLHDGLGGEVLGRDELEALPLPVLLVLDDVEELGVDLREGRVHALEPWGRLLVKLGQRRARALRGCNLWDGARKHGSLVEDRGQAAGSASQGKTDGHGCLLRSCAWSLWSGRFSLPLSPCRTRAAWGSH